jgi:hypothetical protein
MASDLSLNVDDLKEVVATVAADIESRGGTYVRRTDAAVPEELPTGPVTTADGERGKPFSFAESTRPNLRVDGGVVPIGSGVGEVRSTPPGNE